MNHFDRHSTAQEVVRNIDLRGRLIVLTGASSGLGVETARALALTGSDLVLGVRNVQAGEVIARDLAATATGTIRVLPLDLSDLDSVIRFTEQITGAVDVLINNAGVSRTPDAHLANGLDVRFATNHLGHFLLALRLQKQMAQRGARIVVLSSAAHKGNPVRLDDLQWTQRPHVDGAAYAESKSANILFAQEATRRWSAQHIYANAVLPGSALTGLQRYHGEALKRRIGFIHADGSIDPMVKTSEQAAATTVWAATASELAERGGLVLEDCAPAHIAGADTHPWSGFDPGVADAATACRLWEHSLELIRALCGDELSLHPGFDPA
jgi:NAD(P)-dependent dehydrogenase (short-subunit alcohol dehydrogenase family)